MVVYVLFGVGDCARDGEDIVGIYTSKEAAMRDKEDNIGWYENMRIETYDVER